MSEMCTVIELAWLFPRMSDWDVAFEEWEHLQDMLLDHIQAHQPSKCSGLLSQRSCGICSTKYKDHLRGKKLKQKLDAMDYLNRTQGLDGKPRQGIDIFSNMTPVTITSGDSFSMTYTVTIEG